MSKVFNKNMLNPMDVGFEAYKLYSGEQAEIIQIRLPIGQGIPLHKNEKEMVFVVWKGEGKLKIDKEEFLLFEGDCIQVNAGDDREWENVSEEALEILAFKLN